MLYEISRIYDHGSLYGTRPVPFSVSHLRVSERKIRTSGPLKCRHIHHLKWVQIIVERCRSQYAPTNQRSEFPHCFWTLPQFWHRRLNLLRIQWSKRSPYSPPIQKYFYVRTRTNQLFGKSRRQKCSMLGNRMHGNKEEFVHLACREFQPCSNNEKWSISCGKSEPGWNRCRNLDGNRKSYLSDVQNDIQRFYSPKKIFCQAVSHGALFEND